MNLSENARINTAIIQVAASDADVGHNGKVSYNLMNSKDTFSLGIGPAPLNLERNPTGFVLMMDKPVIHATINHGGLAQNFEILVETQN